LSGEGVERALTLTLAMPDAGARREHWRRSFDGQGVAEADEIAARFRMTGGNIRRASKLARAYAALEGRDEVVVEDVRRAARALNRQALDTLATRVEAVGDWASLAVKPETMRELLNLESRCRHRERLHGSVGESLSRQLNAGVRALFTGPSGTGKTLAARLLASVLKMDLYRLDLASVVSKYIGETEKSLNQVFARAEELDVILLLDEGDALLTQRTSVQSSNDRYANLETNYLLQRLESFEGIIVVTTNAGERIDGAFQRRMDVVVDFHAPEPAELRRIWQLHLPDEHAVPQQLLSEVSRRCSLSGGQIRNAVLHASLLALTNGGRITPAYLEAAVLREYRKAGTVCPLRPTYSDFDDAARN
jgi:SpoVK/Ycf46/Vps4 family AAA+-type ATPase